ncbi:MAG: hypothetical protein V3U20_07270 [Thermoplasmata archaeon]
MEFKKRFLGIQSRFELLRLEEDIKEYMTSEIYKGLQEDDKNALDDVFMEIINKKEYFQKGCDPWKSILKS